MASDIKDLINKLSWYHTIDLGNGVVTDGGLDLREYLPYYGFPKSLEGLTAIDVGAASGFFSFEMEKLGAKVLATDIPSWSDHDLHPKKKAETFTEADETLLNAFDVAKKALHSSVDKKAINVYDISKESVGEFDVAFCGSMLLHITDPIKALMNINAVTKKYAIISTQFELKNMHEPLAYLVGNQNYPVWWFLSPKCLMKMAKSAGFKHVEMISLFDIVSDKEKMILPHVVIKAWNIDPPQEERSSNTINALLNPLARMRKKIEFRFKGK